MMRSLFAGVSGMRNHQVKMDVIGNNIANVNTTAFKASRVTFKEAYAQIVQGASRPSGQGSDVVGGNNPVQIGLGMSIGSIDQQFTQGNLENTGNVTDLAITGDSFFVVSDGKQKFFTRAGAFQLDATGRLVAATNGYVVQGRMAVNGKLNDSLTDIKLPFGQKSAAVATTVTNMGGNLRADAADGDTRQTSIAVYDTQGGKHDVVCTFTKNGNNKWDYAITVSDTATGSSLSNDTGTVTFNADGTLNGPDSIDLGFTPAGPNAAQTVKVVFGKAGSASGLSQYAAPSTAVLRDQDGHTMGYLERLSVDSTGTITGAFSNGITELLGQVAVADFNNPAGLIREGNNLYQQSANSGIPVYGYAGEASQSQITSGALEMSNVDLAQEFTNMITAQRGFQANARVITTSDEMLQELANLKR